MAQCKGCGAPLHDGRDGECAYCGMQYVSAITEAQMIKRKHKEEVRAIKTGNVPQGSCGYLCVGSCTAACIDSCSSSCYGSGEMTPKHEATGGQK